ncbi:oligosaccharide flippase family protein [Candidatus Gracilibacteria bacterium]|nr:oligosaccharide flippase family protein [Candidatus Gracilibacteria bacterium]
MPNRKIYTNTLAQIAGKIITALISIFLIKVLTSYLDVAGYGLYSKIYNYLSIFAVIADMGLYTITVRELTKYADDPKMVAKISGNILSLRTLSGVLIIILSLSIAPFLSGYNSLMALVGIFIVSLFTLAGLINSSLMSYLQANLHTEFSLIANTCGKMLTFGMILLFAGLLFPRATTDDIEIFTLVMIAGLAGNILMTGLTWWYTSRYHKIRFAWDKKYILHILQISLPYGLALFLGVIFFKVDVILLSLLEESTIADTSIALYALPMKIVEVGMMYGTIFLNSLLPVLTTAIEKKEKSKIESLTGKGFELLFGFGLAIAIFGFAYTPEIIRIISTPEFLSTTVMGYSSIDAMRIVIWIFLFYFISSLSTYILIARGEQSRMMWINAGIALLNIIGNLLVIPMYSFIGSAWVTLLTQILLMSITWWYVRDSIHIKKSVIFAIFMSIFALIGIGLSLYITSRFIYQNTELMSSLFQVGIGGIIFGSIYLGGWWGIRKKMV